MTQDQAGSNHVSISIGRDLSGQVVTGHGASAESSRPLPDDLLLFVRAVAQALPVLALTPEQHREASSLTTELLRTPEPDRARLVQLAVSLRTILESTAGGALATLLLSSWAGV